MKLLIVVFALAVVGASANLFGLEKPVHPRDFPASVFPSGRITNGQTASAGQFPYQVGLSFTGPSGGWFCGGSLIDNSWVLTAAHCTSSASSVIVYLGATILTSPEQTVTSTTFIQHASYNLILLRNDISLIKIASISYTTNIQNIPLPAIAPSYPTYVGEIAVVSGWGKTSDSATGLATNLQFANLQIIPNVVCRVVNGLFTVTGSNVCGATPNGTSPCDGDSGGPLVIDGKLVGVVTFGSSFGCSIGSPAIFTRVTSYLDWIKTNSGISY